MIIVYDLPKKLAKGSWLPKNSRKTSSGLRNVKMNPGRSDEKSEVEEPGKGRCQGQVGEEQPNERKSRRRRRRIKGQVKEMEG